MDVSKDLAASQHSLANGDFDCNICLDAAMDPIVTLCGHLYCSHCICKWLMFEKESCPVCKASLSLDSLVRLHGRDCRPRTAGRRHRYGGVEFPQSSNSRLRLRGSGDGGVVGGMGMGMYYWSRYGRVRGSGAGMTVRRPEVGVERLLRIWLFMLCSAALCILML